MQLRPATLALAPAFAALLLAACSGGSDSQADTPSRPPTDAGVDATPALDSASGPGTDAGGGAEDGSAPASDGSTADSGPEDETGRSPVASPPGGLFDEPVMVTLSSPLPGATVRYTLDGSKPTARSPVYAAPLTFASLTGTPNELSMIPTTDWDWQPPEGEVLKATVLRAGLFVDDRATGELVSHTYLVHPGATERYSLAVVSLMVERDDLFGHERGIYVPGAAADVCQLDACGNYAQRGEDWEREAHLELFEDPTRPASLSLDVGLRVHGGLTRNFPRKSLRIYARGRYGTPVIEHPLFGPRGATRFRRLILRNSGNDAFQTLLLDGFHHELVEGLGVDTQDYRPVVVLLNGEYWGIHNLRERYDKHYLGLRYGVDREALDIVSEAPADIVQGGVVADEGDLDAWRALLELVARSDMRAEADYEAVAALVDVPNHVTYTAIEVFVANIDWPGNNNKMWRPRDGTRPWQWLLIDTDYASIHGYDADADTLHLPSGDVFATRPLFEGLMRNPSWQQAFLLRMCDLLNTRFHPTHVRRKLAEIAAPLEPAIPEHVARWRAPGSLREWQELVAFIGEWFELRHEFVWEMLLERYELEGPHDLLVEVSDVRAGAVAVGTLHPAELPYPWRGSYPGGMVVPLSAHPVAGKAFVRWEGSVDSDEPNINIRLTGDTRVRAVFSP